MKARLAVSVVSTSVLAACVAVQPVDLAADAQLRPVREQNYTIGVPREISVGDVVLKRKAYDVRVASTNALVSDGAVHLRGGLVTIDIRAGERLQIVGRREIAGTSYLLAQVPDQPANALEVDPQGHLRQRVIGGIGTASIVEVIYQLAITPAEAHFSPIRNEAVAGETFKENFEIVFNGIDGQAMHFQYREFTADNLARPAFSQDLSYPLSSKTVRFKSFSLAVAEVTAEHLRYTVTAD